MTSVVQSSATSVAGASSISRTLTGTVSGNLLAFIVSYIDTAASSSLTPTTPTGFADAVKPASAFNATTAANGSCIFYQVSAGGSVTATFNEPAGALGGLYAEAVLVEFDSMSGTPFDLAATTVTNNSAASTTGATVGPSGTLAQSNELVIAAACLSCSTGLANAGLSDPPSGYTSLAAAQNTSTGVGAEIAWKEAGSTTGQSATWAWTTDATMGAYQLVLATFKETGGGAAADAYVSMPPLAPPGGRR